MDESRIKHLLSQGDAGGAVAVLVQACGSEVYGYLCHIVKDEDLAHDAFSEACERALRDIAAVRDVGSMRAWFYAVARHAALREVKQRARRRAQPISQLSEVLAAQVRSATLTQREAAVKDKLEELRSALTSEQQELLVLRVDRQLSWEEIARICSGEENPSEALLKRRSAACRKQFERAKDRIRELALSAGLLRPGD